MCKLLILWCPRNPGNPWAVLMSSCLGIDWIPLDPLADLPKRPSRRAFRPEPLFPSEDWRF